eukprot:1152021-Pelagomonas_calceolata.AAC.8
MARELANDGRTRASNHSDACGAQHCCEDGNPTHCIPLHKDACLGASCLGYRHTHTHAPELKPVGAAAASWGGAGNTPVGVTRAGAPTAGAAGAPVGPTCLHS